uniref:Uncharacterized protein n=1 Tax=Helicotheca tamesis TaxID=374047 RepID=A0A7S2GQS3_9STRA|mmetsp:Transcript_10859/g.15111  ORF Transcript_10859/g.15111 Transcript_10859/m.15111 type:complete len:264 (+) Transcript_10859:52-843(+)
MAQVARKGAALHFSSYMRRSWPLVVSFAMTTSTRDITPIAVVAKTVPTPDHSIQSPKPTVASEVADIPTTRFAKTPYAWDELVDIVERKQDLSLLARSVEQQRVYKAYRDALRREWKTVYDHILHSKFGFQKRIVSSPPQESGTLSSDSAEYNDIDPKNPLWEAFPPLEEVNSSQLSLCRNDFPYYFEDGIEHWCLWKLGGSVTPEEIENAKQKLMNSKDVVKTLHWINPPHLKSLPDIDHAHILCLRKGVKNDFQETTHHSI